MNIGFSPSSGSFALASSMPSQAQVSFQGAMCGTQTARDSVQRVTDRNRSLSLIGARVGTLKVTVQAAKVGAKKKA